MLVTNSSGAAKQVLQHTGKCGKDTQMPEQADKCTYRLQGPEQTG